MLIPMCVLTEKRSCVLVLQMPPPDAVGGRYAAGLTADQMQSGSRSHRKKVSIADAVGAHHALVEASGGGGGALR